MENEYRVTLNKGNFELTLHGKAMNVDIKLYENPKEEKIEIKEDVKENVDKV